ncbi:MAG: mechanosensitive ion channel [Sphingobacteriaceae bacterium]|nr:mechanosensitive ion channel [Sphingobacteriaceae bacterium]
MKLQDHIDKIVDTIIQFAPQVVSALLVLIIGLWVIKRIAYLANKGFEKKDLDVSLRTFLKSLISIGLKIILIVTVAGMLGIGTASFVTILGAAGLAVGLALQGSLSNFAGGVLILIFKPYKVGDTIEAQGQTGEVMEIQIFNTILLTAEHKTVILPNGALSNGTIVNNSRHGNVRVDIPLAVSVENDLPKVKAIISEALNSNVHILKTPEPLIVIGKILEGAVNINVRPYCHPDNAPTVISEVNENLKVAFEKNKIKQAVQMRIIHNV